MRILQGLYKAVCLDVVGSTRIRCKIPQIFAEEIVTILDAAGAMPTAGAEGWVAFESGFPDRPVWVGTNLKGGITDHGALLGLDDDDHPQYLTAARGDALFLTPAEGNTAYVNVSGDTMTGPLTVPTPPTAAGHAASKAYADSHDMPAGGTTAQVLAKTSNTDYATGWVDAGIQVVTALPGTLSPNVLYVVVT